ncbi:hypothetical protein M9H77_12181 [Catharanthus roseus]|uniref:Uncharacterized protein n=1 Tax=Catharanthus roseus TaxID=4058 RepID=A0ACC0BGU7_CATRO|nr:hypothetical protein M9H77_12181 [Catharanthus roseus]
MDSRESQNFGWVADLKKFLKHCSFCLSHSNPEGIPALSRLSILPPLPPPLSFEYPSSSRRPAATRRRQRTRRRRRRLLLCYSLLLQLRCYLLFLFRLPLFFKFEEKKKGSKPVEETLSNKGNVNNEDRGKKPRVGVEFSDCEIIGNPGLHKAIA